MSKKTYPEVHDIGPSEHLMIGAFEAMARSLEQSGQILAESSPHASAAYNHAASLILTTLVSMVPQRLLGPLPAPSSQEPPTTSPAPDPVSQVLQDIASSLDELASDYVGDVPIDQPVEEAKLTSSASALQFAAGMLRDRAAQHQQEQEGVAGGAAAEAAGQPGISPSEVKDRARSLLALEDYEIAEQFTTSAEGRAILVAILERLRGDMHESERWETGFRNIATVLGYARKPFDIPDIVARVRQIATAERMLRTESAADLLSRRRAANLYTASDDTDGARSIFSEGWDACLKHYSQY